VDAVLFRRQPDFDIFVLGRLREPGALLALSLDLWTTHARDWRAVLFSHFCVSLVRNIVGERIATIRAALVPAQQLHVVGVDADRRPRLAVGVLPAVLLERTFDGNLLALRQVLCDSLAALSPVVAVEERRFVLPLVAMLYATIDSKRELADA
jgi:hypothetical protein